MKVKILKNNDPTQIKLSITDMYSSYGPLLLKIPYIFSTITIPDSSFYEIMTSFLAKANDKKTAQKFLEVVKQRKGTHYGLEKLVREAKQENNIKIEIKKQGNNNVGFILTDNKDLSYLIKNNFSMISHERVSKTDFIKLQFDESITYEMPEYWNNILTRQKDLHNKLAKFNDITLFKFRWKLAYEKKKYVQSALELEDKIRDIANKHTSKITDISGVLRYKLTEEFKQYLFLTIKEEDYLNNNQDLSTYINKEIGYTPERGISNKEIKEWCIGELDPLEIDSLREEFHKNLDKRKKITKYKTAFTNYVKYLNDKVLKDKDPKIDYDEKLRFATIKLSWMKLSWMEIDEISERTGIKPEKILYKNTNKEAFSLLKEIHENYQELSSIVDKLGGNTNIDIKKLKVDVELNDSLFNLKEIDETEYITLISIDTELIGWRNSSLEPGGYNPRIVNSCVSKETFQINKDGTINDFYIDSSKEQIELKPTTVESYVIGDKK